VKGIAPVAPVATAVAAWLGAIIAYRGLNKWRAERKFELAEEVFADFCEARDIIQAARRSAPARRSSMSFGHEGDTHTKDTSETEVEAPPDEEEA
jgi:hypothetical protein